MQRVTVERKWLTAEGIMAFSLVDSEGRGLPPFSPGAHITVRLQAPGQASVLRTYSLCNGPGELASYVLGVKREPASRGGSSTMHDIVAVGETLEISMPQNHFPLSPDATSHLLLAAGIGITPLLAMAQHLDAEGADYALHYFARGAAHVAFRERLQAAELAGCFHLHLGLDSVDTEQCVRTLLAAPGAGSHAYACGPPPFMDLVAKVGVQDWDAQRLHFEHFQAPATETENEPGAFELHLARSNLRCIVAADETIVAAAARMGYTIEVSCEQGVCGTCLTNVVAGIPDHRDAYLTDAEQAMNDQMLVCVGRARSAILELDL